MGMLLEWQVWKINFLLWKHEMVMGLDIDKWEHSNVHSHSHIQCLLMRVPIRSHRSMWSQSDQIILLLQHITSAVQNHCR